jgi:hypothetical protein
MALTIDQAYAIQRDLDGIRETQLTQGLKIKDVVGYIQAGFFCRLIQNIVSVVTCHGLMSTRVERALLSVSKEKFDEIKQKNMLEYHAISKVQFDQIFEKFQVIKSKNPTKADLEKEGINIADMRMIGDNATRSLEIHAFFLLYLPHAKAEYSS